MPSSAGLFAGLLFLAGLFVACQPAPLTRRESYVFGTRVEILVADARKPEAEAATAEILREFDRLNRVYHAWRPSELTALNDALAAGRRANVTPEMRDFLREARELAAQGGYRFDPGIGRLIRLWGFQNDEFQARLPDPEMLANWRARPASIAELHVDGATAWSGNPSLALDFGGYLKGAALDRAAAMLKARGIGSALINIGGNVMALGDKYGQPWKVGIQHPREPGPMAILALKDGEAVGTSGDYQRYFELEGRRYSHLLDPRAGEPVRHTQAVTVLVPASDRAGALSDALSKPLFIAGPRHWREAARQAGITQALRVDADGRVEVTPALNVRLAFMGNLRVTVTR
ncbi:MAG: FAD:protein FMN transferase [Zoogloeaceae bacterium]|jgi:thiamine biosynthesis lipoprotein|nr:FAD:protein FMN transferase [Zoogloeaceae bacterium]